MQQIVGIIYREIVPSNDDLQSHDINQIAGLQCLFLYPKAVDIGSVGAPLVCKGPSIPIIAQTGMLA